MKPKVYLSGPINGISYSDCNDWREEVSRQLADNGIDAISPLRGKNDLAGIQCITDGNSLNQGTNPLRTDRAVFVRDKWDTLRCDLILCNLLHTKQVSIGTMFELAWAELNNIPVVLAMETIRMEDHQLGDHLVQEVIKPIHDHPFVREATGVRTDNMEDALQIIITMLNEETNGK
jgi:nucleoside 2-deoxyribosyltransferase